MKKEKEEEKKEKRNEKKTWPWLLVGKVNT